MTNQEIFELMDRFEGSSLTSMKLSMDGFQLELEKGGTALSLSAMPDNGAGAMQRTGTADSGAGSGTAPAAGHTDPQAAGIAAAGSMGTKNAKDGSFITAPMVGTFYAAPAPQQSPFVVPGDRVSRGQTVCLMEAMKMISEIPAPCDCIIEELLKADGALAAYGDPLFRYRPC